MTYTSNTEVRMQVNSTQSYSRLYTDRRQFLNGLKAKLGSYLQGTPLPWCRWCVTETFYICDYYDDPGPDGRMSATTVNYTEILSSHMTEAAAKKRIKEINMRRARIRDQQALDARRSNYEKSRYEEMTRGLPTAGVTK